MRFIFLFIITLFFSSTAFSQNKLVVSVKNAEDNESLAGATVMVEGLKMATKVNAYGLAVLQNIPNGKQQIIVRFLGFEENKTEIVFPRNTTDTLLISLQPEEEEMDEVVVQSTRSSRTIKNIPTRVEFIAGEELDEKANMKPGDIRMVLSESTGIQVQQTSATTANASIRIQGLDGRYTQILKDGMPLYEGFSGGLGLLQTPPLDLKQVEVVKGSASTLYGGGAIAGLVNLISKTPTPNRELNFFLNGTSAGGLDLNGFFAQKFNKIGLTLYAARNSNKPYDPSDIDLTAIPKFERYTINPKLFVDFNKNLKLNVGVNMGFEDRIGGDLHYIDGKGDTNHSYFENNNSNRVSGQGSLEWNTGKIGKLTFKSSFNSFKRELTTPGYEFNGQQLGSFSELNYAANGEKMEWVGGLNLLTDKFTEQQYNSFPLRNYDLLTVGGFIQNNWTATGRINVETGLRTDYVRDYGFAFLPRLSVLVKLNNHFNTRMGGGLGYKTPTIFTEESERLQYKGVLPINTDENILERSYGVNWDVNFSTSLFNNTVGLSINQLFFYTYLNNPLVLQNESNGVYKFENIDGYGDSKGSETNAKITYDDFKLFLGYTYTDAENHYQGLVKENTLTAKHRLNSVLMYELHDKWKLGLEAYYFSPQLLSDGTRSQNYWITGFMAERLWERFSLFINFENFLDVRQTKYGSIYTGPITNPVFKDLYAPLDGFVVNGGLKLRL
ncbi:hypothetical protein C3K47_03175 [Solitalea longa]|uniref:TonB-dependent receptor plug domain-containing protein n=1 Tax=Solitalea longa TaxID=2079460 RepID=A0A2S5A790_9SPHI|nr:TonB-dependent receptor plug domain-containing protein [Solitalea longa]POY38415.1 hypothetical protein C3K47_03175 [Solitalea longa]